MGACLHACALIGIALVVRTIGLMLSPEREYLASDAEGEVIASKKARMMAILAWTVHPLAVCGCQLAILTPLLEAWLLVLVDILSKVRVKAQMCTCTLSHVYVGTYAYTRTEDDFSLALSHTQTYARTNTYSLSLTNTDTFPFRSLYSALYFCTVLFVLSSTDSRHPNGAPTC